MMEKAPDTSTAHPIFHKNPSDYMQYVYKEICVETRDGASHSGYLYTTDPVSESMVLVKFCDGRMRELKWIMGHSITGVTVIDDDVSRHKADLDMLFKSDMNVENLSPEELTKRKMQLKSWLLKNRLPVSTSPEDPDMLCLADALTIRPPYRSENCQSTNEIILDRVQNLVKNMPESDDFSG